MAASFTSPLVGSHPTRKGSPKAGDLVTVLMYKGGECALQMCARLERTEAGTAFVKLIGLDVPAPYQIGQRFPIPMERVADW